MRLKISFTNYGSNIQRRFRIEHQTKAKTNNKFIHLNYWFFDFRKKETRAYTIYGVILTMRWERCLLCLAKYRMICGIRVLKIKYKIWYSNAWDRDLNSNSLIWNLGKLSVKRFSFFFFFFKWFVRIFYVKEIGNIHIQLLRLISSSSLL